MVPAWIVAHRVRLSIDLNRQPTLEAGKIDYVAVDGELSAKAESVWPFAELLPEDHFRQRQLATQLTSKANVGVGRTDRTMPNANAFGPSTMLCMVPLPVPGRI